MRTPSTHSVATILMTAFIHLVLLGPTHALGARGGSEAHDDHDDPDSIHLDPAEKEEFGIQLRMAGSGVIREEMQLPGEIRMNEHAVAHVGPRFDGVVTAIRKRLGDRVRVGDVLAGMETNDTLRPFELKAPLDGTIVSFHATMGESMQAGVYAFIIADTATVWADLSVYQRDLPRVRMGQAVRLSAGKAFPIADGEISYLGPTVDEVTRTGLARVVLDNQEGIYLPGLFVVGQITVSEDRFPVVVPLTALQSLEGETVVFVANHNGDEFRPQSVRLGRRDRENAEVQDGLEAGQRYVATGGFFLKAELQRENFGDGHDH